MNRLRILDRLRHDTTGGAQYTEIDAFRGWACLLVLVGHILAVSADKGFIDIPSKFYRFGGPGVFLFFFISGFLLFMKWGKAYYGGKPAPDLGMYFKRRLLRIFPAYYANLAIIVGLYGTLFLNPIFANKGTADLLQHVFLLHNISVSNYSSINAVAWTLPIEFQFYIILPFIASWFFGKRNFGSVPLLVVFSVSYCLITYYFVSSRGELDYFLERAVREQLATLLFMFIAGISFSNLWLYIKTEEGALSVFATKGFGNVLLVCGLILLALLWYIRPEGLFVWGYLWTVPYVFACGMVVFGTMQTSLGTLRSVIVNPVTEFTGIISYSLYLWHWPVLMNMEYWLPMEGMTGREKLCVLALATILVSVTVSVISYMLFEKPFLKIRSSRLG